MSVILVLATSRLEYCNILYLELPLKTDQKLSFVLNIAVGVLFVVWDQEVETNTVTSLFLGSIQGSV